MLVMDGLTATRIISRKYPRVRVIAHSLSEILSQEHQAREAGASNYIVKGASIDAIAGVIRAAGQMDGQHPE
jgi:DNA-binding NarL/FixJ family response regulator